MSLKKTNINLSPKTGNKTKKRVKNELSEVILLKLEI